MSKSFFLSVHPSIPHLFIKTTANVRFIKLFLSQLTTIASGLAFLCKGPFSIDLTGLPTLVWPTIRNDFSWLKRIPWIICIMLFLGITIPWFALSEIRHPGFLRYFIWKENITRYFLKDYSDRYGEGHILTSVCPRRLCGVT